MVFPNELSNASQLRPSSTDTTDTWAKSLNELMDLGLPREYAGIAATYYVNNFRNAQKSPMAEQSWFESQLSEATAADFSELATVTPRIMVSIEKRAYKTLKDGTQHKRYAIVFNIDGNEVEMQIGSKDQAMVYIATLLRSKIGVPIYRYELVNHLCPLAPLKGKTTKWLESLYNALFPYNATDFLTWCKNLQKNNAHSLNQGKSQVNDKVKKALSDYPQDAVDRLTIKIEKQDRGKSYFIDIPAECINIPNELQSLLDEFQEIDNNAA